MSGEFAERCGFLFSEKTVISFIKSILKLFLGFDALQLEYPETKVLSLLLGPYELSIGASVEANAPVDIASIKGLRKGIHATTIAMLSWSVVAK